MLKVEFNFSKNVDIDSIAKTISDFFGHCPDQDPADARLTIGEKGHEITHRWWNAGQNPRPHEIATHIATVIADHTSGKDDYFSGTAKVFFPPRRSRP